MAWGKVDDKLWGSPKWLATGPRARALWVSALSWCMDQLTDGVVPVHVVPVLGGTKRDAGDLVRSGLWEENPEGGWLFHDWADYQPSREQVLAERKAAAERQKRAREKAKAKRDGTVTRESRRDSDRDSTRESRSPRPDPTHTHSDTHLSSSGGSFVTRDDEPPPDEPEFTLAQILLDAGVPPWMEEDFLQALKDGGAKSTTAMVIALHRRGELHARVKEWQTERDRAANAPRVITPNVTRTKRAPDGKPVTELCGHDFEVGRCPTCRAEETEGRTA